MIWALTDWSFAMFIFERSSVREDIGVLLVEGEAVGFCWGRTVDDGIGGWVEGC